jgi:hypothetical protein
LKLYLHRVEPCKALVGLFHHVCIHSFLRFVKVDDDAGTSELRGINSDVDNLEDASNHASYEFLESRKVFLVQAVVVIFALHDFLLSVLSFFS